MNTWGWAVVLGVGILFAVVAMSFLRYSHGRLSRTDLIDLVLMALAGNCVLVGTAGWLESGGEIVAGLGVALYASWNLTFMRSFRRREPAAEPADR